MQTRVASIDLAEREEAEAWLSWARRHRERIDPLHLSLRLPPDPEFTPDVIAPFMPGRSPHGSTANRPR